MRHRYGNMIQDDIDYVKECIKNNEVHRFYIWSKWLRVRKEILKRDHNECVDCRAAGRYTKATTVHHINHVKHHPELALEAMYIDDKGCEQRNLISLCHKCHEKRHGYRQKNYRAPLTEERWD